MNNQTFYICKVCGNLVGMIHSSGVPLVCCGEEMEQLTANTVEASREKHLPAVSVAGDTVSVVVGSVEHPMTPAHAIEWIYLQTRHGGQRKALAADGAPKAEFALTGDEPVAVYAYCNLHGLWKTEL